MGRINEAGGDLPASVNGVLAHQTKRYGSPLANHLVLARCPQVFAAFRAMWDALDSTELLPPALLSLVNLRVASLIGCGL
jgi:hypothetical protein